ncbi:hypothetical protein [Dyadobacter diqingensis]|uniref:hypothetical protein n=1 Tax=Dyadobacter diqingensis TaxID=2938121 RepID=UPI0020C18E31|nr:hypothetical protein [Dyadobacter diqingensis]
MKHNETFWEKIREDRHTIEDDERGHDKNKNQRNTNLIAPLYYFLYHNSLSIKHFEHDNFSFSTDHNPLKSIDDLPYIQESKLIRLISGTYRDISLYTEKGENFIVVSKLEIDLSGKVDMIVQTQGIGFVDAQNKDLNRGFVKFIEQVGGIYFIVVAMRYNYRGHYHDMLLNLEFKVQNEKALEIGEFITGHFQRKVFILKNRLPREYFLKE